MDLSPTLIESIIMLAITGNAFWLWHLKGKLDDVKSDYKQDVHNLEKRMIEEYAKKQELKEVVADALAPLKEMVVELKQELRHTIRALDSYNKYGPPE